MKRLFEQYRVEPLLCLSNTAAASQVRKIKWNGEDRMSFLCGFGGAAVAGGVISATATSICQFTITESTASTAAGSAISGATKSLGCATAYKVKSADALAITMTSAVTTSAKLHINGYEYYCTVSGVGSSGENVAGQIASAINGAGTFKKLPHYSAYPNFGDTGVVLIAPDDGEGTGLSISTAGATDFKPRITRYYGAIELYAKSLSTNRPKWIGASVSTYAGASCIRSVECFFEPNHKPAFGGVSTFV